MSRFLPWLAVSALSFAACGDGDGGSNPSDTSRSDASGDTSAPPPGTSPLTGVNTSVTVTNPNPDNTGCTASTSTPLRTDAVTYPWGGETVAGRTYACNACPSGLPQAQGRYRLHGFADADGKPCSPADAGCKEDYTTPDAKTDMAEVLILDGNTFRTIYKDVKNGTQSDTKGYYFCGMKPEGPNEHLVWVDLPNQGQGPFTESDIILGSGNNILIKWYDDVNVSNSATGVEYKYCKIGGSNDPYGNPCADPFK